jgi:ubiquinol-cytochrome c reductase cytochrome c subunit
MKLVHSYLVPAVCVVSLAFTFPAAAAASPENGKAAFIKYGCWQCHGFEGQGSIATSGGKVIADTQLPLDAFMAFVRTTNTEMPPFSKDILSDSDLQDIYAYLESRPKPEPPKDIPLLRDLQTR